MKIDWNVRFKNPYFWIGLIGLFFATIQVEPSMLTNWGLLVESIKDFACNPFLVGSFVVALLGYINNPTTKGLND